MSEELTRMERRLRKAAALVLVGLIVEGLSLLWARPLSFILFLGVGATLIALGIVIFLMSLVSASTHHKDGAPDSEGVLPDGAKEATQAQ